MTPTFALAIPHAAHLENRRASLKTMLAELAPHVDADTVVEHHDGPVPLFVFRERTRGWWEWAEAIWQWGVKQDTTHVVFLNDDLRVAPFFWRKLSALVRAVPDHVIGLASVYPAARHFARNEKRRLYTSTDHLIGPGGVFPMSLFRLFMGWRKTSLRPAAKTKVSEDIQVDLWHIVTGRKIVHPIPSLIDHSLELGSSYGLDGHLYRKVQVTWEDGDVCDFQLEDLESVSFWLSREPAHVGRYFKNTPYLAHEWIVDPPEDAIFAAMADTPPPEILRFFNLGDPFADPTQDPCAKPKVEENT